MTTARLFLTSLLFAAGCGADRRTTDAARLAADSVSIQKLHSADMAAVVAKDTATLMSLWTDDIVSLQARGPILVGRDVNAAALRASMKDLETMTPVSYTLNFRELEILGDVAIEWGTLSAVARPTSGGANVVTGGKLMRILRRQRDGSWRVWRTIYTEDAPPN